MAQQWGRKETIIWPPQTPVYTYGAFFLSLLVICAALRITFVRDQTPLQQFYTPAYFRSSMVGIMKRPHKYRLLYISDARGHMRLAAAADVVAGNTDQVQSKPLDMAASPEAISHGWVALFKGAEAPFQDARLNAWLRAAVFESQSLSDIYEHSLFVGLIAFLLLLPASITKDIKRRKVMKYGRLLKGPVMLAPKEFNQILGGNGLGIRTDQKGIILRIPDVAESKHIQVMGDTGAGKTTLLMQMLKQIEDRRESAIVYDPAGEFIQRFYREGRGDVVLNPMDARCPFWTPSDELRNPAEARTVAASLYQPNSKNKGEFFTETPQKIFARLLLYRPTPRELAEWMSNEEEIDKRVEGTPMKAMIAKGAQQQRSGVLASLGLVSDGLMLLPTREQATQEWSANEWSKKREGWIFLTGKKSEREALRPLQSLWIDLLILRLLEVPEDGQKRVWFVLDEIASLQRLPQLPTALVEGRKSNNPIILCYQGKSQLEKIYDLDAEAMLSQPATKYVMKTAEPKAAKWASELIGDIEIERVRETVADGKRSGKSFTLDRQVEPLVMSSEIEGLSDLHSFIKLGNYVSRFSFSRLSMPIIAPAFIAREGAADTFWLDDPASEPTSTTASPQPLPAAVDAQDQDPTPEHAPTLVDVGRGL